MAFTAQQGAYNVEGSFNIWFQQNITGNLPSWIDGPYFSASGVNFNYPEKSLTFPSYSISYLGTQEVPGSPNVGLGGSAVRMNHLMLDVSCWASRTNTAGGTNDSVRRDVLELRDMAVSLIMSGKQAINILDYQAETITADSVVGLLRLRQMDEPVASPDPKPHVHRRRIVATYAFQELWRPN